MATNIDFDTLINRIEVATDTLEVTVGNIDQSVETIVEHVDEAEAFAHAAEIAATAAQDFSAQAGLEAIAASQARQDAEQAKEDAQELVTALEQAVIIEEAPVDGKQYARSNAEWVEVEASGGGTVQSVNSVLPDSQGNITLEYEDIPNTPSLAPVATTGSYEDLSDTPNLSTVATSGSYNDLSDKPTIPTQGILSIVEGSGVTVDNTDPLNPVISATGGGSTRNFPGYPINGVTKLYYGNGLTYPPDPSKLLDSYPYENPNTPLIALWLWFNTGSSLINFQTAITTSNYNFSLWAQELAKVDPDSITTQQMTLPGGKANSYYCVTFRKGGGNRRLLQAQMIVDSGENINAADVPELRKTWVWTAEGATRGWKLLT